MLPFVQEAAGTMTTAFSPEQKLPQMCTAGPQCWAKMLADSIVCVIGGSMSQLFLTTRVTDTGSLCIHVASCIRNSVQLFRLFSRERLLANATPYRLNTLQ